ncbi:hypothetical protein MAJ_10704, partial [Metarhizium majus ARSEF 297]
MANQIIHLGWEATNVPDSGLKDITFPMAMPNAPHEEGYYFEQAVHFENIPEGMDPTLVIYTGLQPRPDKNGKSIVHVAFSSFFPGTTSLDSNCYDTADGGPGVSCEKEVESSYDDIYHLRIRAYNETYYFGTLINHSSGQRWSMGSFNLPTGVSGMKGGDWAGFMEYYLTPDCSKYPDTAAIFGTPFTSTAGVNIRLTYPYQDPTCDNNVAWHVSRFGQGALEITIGKNATSDNDTSKRSVSSIATQASTSSTAISGPHSPTDEPTPHPGWNGSASSDKPKKLSSTCLV